MCVICNIGLASGADGPFGRRGLGRRGLSRLGLRFGLGGLAASVLRGAPAAAGPALPLIMLDPGHGGHDPGAIAPDGLFEKRITLAAGLTLRDTLAATGRYRVRMTRETDVFIPLGRRVADAVAAKADLFLSLHCDHLPEPALRGASVFTLSDQASDQLAAGLAQEDNGTSPERTASLPNVSPRVADILASLETRATRLNSASLAQDIAQSFAGVVPLLPDPERSADFAVLRDASTPSALLEMGCLTNKLDERLLRDPAHRRALTGRVALAIDRYFAHDAGGRLAG
jgi:N-acetylmuramoyl-L-alanine amidase